MNLFKAFLPVEHSEDVFEARSRSLAAQTWFLWLPRRSFRLAEECYSLGAECRASGHVSLAEANLKRALELLAMDHSVEAKKSLPRQHLIASCQNHLGILWLDQGKPERAVAPLDQAIAVRRNLMSLYPRERENHVYLGGALCNRGHACADSDPVAAAAYYKESLQILRQPEKTCECSYWDEERESWWCSQLEALGQCLGAAWVELAPQFIDNAKKALAGLKLP